MACKGFSKGKGKSGGYGKFAGGAYGKNKGKFMGGAYTKGKGGVADAWQGSWAGSGQGDWPQSGEWSSSAWGSEAGHGGDETGMWNGRVTANYTFAKASLRPYVDSHGSALNTAATDGAFLSNDHLRAHLSASNTMTVRKPATGLSTASMTIGHGAQMLETLGMKEITGPAELMGSPALHKLLATEDGLKFLKDIAILNTDGAGKDASPEARLAGLKSAKTFLKQHKATMSQALAQQAIASSRLYLMAMNFLEVLVFFTNPKATVHKMPPSAFPDEADAHKLRDAFSEDAFLKAVVGMFTEKARLASEYQGSVNEASSVLDIAIPAEEDEEEKDEHAKAPKRRKIAAAMAPVELGDEEDDESDEEPVTMSNLAALWPKDEVKKIVQVIEAAEKVIGEKTAMKLDSFKDTVGGIPGDVLLHFGMGNLVDDLGKRTKMPPKTQLRALFQRLLGACAEVLTEHSEDEAGTGEVTPRAEEEVTNA